VPEHRVMMLAGFDAHAKECVGRKGHKGPMFVRRITDMNGSYMECRLYDGSCNDGLIPSD